jgi:hypothetical protein
MMTIPRSLSTGSSSIIEQSTFAGLPASAAGKLTDENVTVEFSTAHRAMTL